MTRREKVLVSILAVICGVGAFLWFYLIPMVNNIDQLRNDIRRQEAANMTSLAHSAAFIGLTNELYGIRDADGNPHPESLYALWHAQADSIVESFDPTEAMRFIESLVNPRVLAGTALSINFGSIRELPGLEVHPATITFTVVNRLALMDILESFYNFPVENRITSYTVSSRGSNAGIANGELSVSLTVEFIAQRS